MKQLRPVPMWSKLKTQIKVNTITYNIAKQIYSVVNSDWFSRYCNCIPNYLFIIFEEKNNKITLAVNLVVVILVTLTAPGA